MGFLEKAKGISQEKRNDFTVIMGKPGSGKTTLAGSYPKPILYVTIDTDGGGEVLKGYSDDEISVIALTNDVVGTQGAKHVQTKCMELINELKTSQHKFKTVIFDAYSSIEEGLVRYLIKLKGKNLSIDERGAVSQLMTDLRDSVVELSRQDVAVVAICHIKDKETTDNTTGDKSTMLVPKMSYTNGNILLERASNVMYCSKRTVIRDDNTRDVAFLTYVGAHPNIDTKIRVKGKTKTTGMYIENLTYDKIKDIIDNNDDDKNVKQLKVIETQVNPFNNEDKEEN